MIPCRLFLQSYEQNSENQQKVRINLTLNSLFYDEIKPFQTKYFCLTSTDTIGVEIVYANNERLIGKTYISNCAKRALENQNIQLNISPSGQSKLNKIKLAFLIQPVSSFSRKQLGFSTNNNRITNNFQEYEKQNLGQISFSQKDPLMESQDIMNFSKAVSPRDQYNETLKTVEQADSLQSLAHQRQKILGELFGRFKRDK